MSYLERWNAMGEAEAAEAVLPCCGSRAWAMALVKRRPLTTLPEMLAASDAAWWGLPESDWNEAFKSHPRIGERRAQGTATAVSLQWSAGEQSLLCHEASATAANGDAFKSGGSSIPRGTEELLKKKIAEANREYEERFGRVFLIRATGRNPGEILTELERRMRNTDEAELQEAAEQQREITHLRLQKWLAAEEVAEDSSEQNIRSGVRKGTVRA